MSKDLINWEINWTNHGLLDINMALEEMQSERTTEGFSIPAIDYSELDMFDSVSLNFAVSMEFTDADYDIKSVDDLMNPAYNPVNDTAYRSSFPPNDQAEALDNLSLYCNQIIQPDNSDLLQALQEITASTADLLDATRAHLDNTKIKDYEMSHLFINDNVDLDTYDTTSIKVMDSDPVFPAAITDWPGIFAEIERYVGDVFSHDISDMPVPDLHYKAFRSGMTLVKGKGRSHIRSLFNIPEYYSQNTFNFNDGNDSSKSFNVPMQFSMENGELIFKVNLKNIDLSYLEQISHLPAEMNMKSVLSLIPRKVKAK